MPSVIAAMAGGMMAAATPRIAAETSVGTCSEAKAGTSTHAAMANAAPAVRNHLYLVRSINQPTGVCAITVARFSVSRKTPMDDSVQCDVLIR